MSKVSGYIERLTRGDETATWWPYSRDVYKVRKVLKGLVIGPIDKNNGESSAVCPVLYEHALEGMYTEATGYQEVWIHKYTTYQKRKLGVANMKQHVVQTCKPKDGQTGGMTDLMKVWKDFYRSKGLARYGASDPMAD